MVVRGGGLSQCLWPDRLVLREITTRIRDEDHLRHCWDPAERSRREFSERRSLVSALT